MRRALSFLFIFLISFSVFSIEYQPGIIETKSGKEIHCDIDVYEYGVIITGSKIKYNLNGKKEKIKLSEINKIILGPKIYEIISYKKVVKTGPNRGTKKITLLAELIETGKVNLYTAYFIQSSPGAMMPMANGTYMPIGGGRVYLSEKKYLVNNEKVKWITKLDFKKSLKKMFPDCELLLVKVKEESLKMRDIHEVVIFGNANCTSNN